jgi:hypothetical protein
MKKIKKIIFRKISLGNLSTTIGNDWPENFKSNVNFTGQRNRFFRQFYSWKFFAPFAKASPWHCRHCRVFISFIFDFSSTLPALNAMHPRRHWSPFNYLLPCRIR